MRIWLIATANVKTRSTTDRVTPTFSVASPDFVDIEQPEKDRNERVADADTLATEQKSCPSLQYCWERLSKTKATFSSIMGCYTTEKQF